MKITQESKRVFEMYAKDSNNWAGNPFIGANVGGSKEERGNITQLKVAGLIHTQWCPDARMSFITFSPEGVRLAESMGIPMHYYGERLND